MEIGSKALWLFALAAVCSRFAAAQTPDSARRAQVVAPACLQPVNQGETEPARRPAWLEASAGIGSPGARRSKVGAGELVGGVVGGIVVRQALAPRQGGARRRSYARDDEREAYVASRSLHGWPPVPGR